MIRPYDFPSNYNWLPLEKQRDIENWLTEYHKQYHAALMRKTQGDEKAASDMMFYKSRINGAARLLHTMGIKYMYDIPGYRNRAKLMTYQDAEEYLDWEIQCAD